jgi:transposase InsO family protein
VVNPQMRREAVLVMQLEVELSQRRACGLMELYRATCRYRRRRGEDQQLRVRLRELAEARRRFGYRRLHCGASVDGSGARCASRCLRQWQPSSLRARSTVAHDPPGRPMENGYVESFNGRCDAVYSG